MFAIVLGGCNVDDDSSKDYEQTVVNNSKYTVLCKNVEISTDTTVNIPVTVDFNDTSADELTFSYKDAEYPRV